MATETTIDSSEIHKRQEQLWQEFEKQYGGELLLSESETRARVKKLHDFLAGFFEDHPEAKCAVVGVTGGLGGTLAAALLKDIGINVVGVHVPMRADAKRIATARRSTAHFCSDYVQVDGFGHVFSGERLPERIFQFLSETPALAKKYVGETRTPQRISLIRARLRMIALSDVAAKTEGKIVATESLSEILYGRVAKYGDVGDVKPFHGIFKGTEMTAIARYMGLDELSISKAEKEWHRKDLLAATTNGYLGKEAQKALESLQQEVPQAAEILKELDESSRWKDPAVLTR